MGDRTQVLVVGAGPVGLTAALKLAHAGIDIRIVDAAQAIDERLRASTFHPPTLDMIDELGLCDLLEDRGLKVPRWQMRQHESGRQVTFDLAALADETQHPYRLQVEQHHYAALAAAALDDIGIAVEYSSELTSLKQDADGVTARLASGESIRCQWLIGADGANSATRHALGIDYEGTTHTHASVLLATDFPFDEVWEDLCDVTYCWSQRGPFSLLRLKSCWRVSLYPGTPDVLEAAEEARVREWLRFIHPDAHRAAISNLRPYRVHERCVACFRAGRVLLAGDAAHLNPPSGGMGMNGGIHDAVNLSDKLAHVINGGDEGILDLYDRQRRHVASTLVIPQAAANRARMAIDDPEAQQERLGHFAAITQDPVRLREYLRNSAMLSSLEEAGQVE